MKKVLKTIGLILLFVSMAYASNWDLPKETKEDWKQKHKEEIEAYYINHETYVEELEAWCGSIPEEFLERENEDEE